MPERGTNEQNNPRTQSLPASTSRNGKTARGKLISIREIMNSSLDIRIGDSLQMLRQIPDESVQACITSPPYWRLRKYGDDPKELGQEATPEEYVSSLVTIFREVNRILKSDGTFWLVIGDSSASSSTYNAPQSLHTQNGWKSAGVQPNVNISKSKRIPQGSGRWEGGLAPCSGDLKPLDLVGIPWLTAFGLRKAGWYLRSEVIWNKKNCKPESVGRKKNKWTFKNGRPTRSHETIFLFSKSDPYYYDSEAIAEPCIWDVDGTGTASRKARASSELKSHPNGERAGIRPSGFKDARKFEGKNGVEKQRGHSRRHAGFNERWDKMDKETQCSGLRNRRDVWTIAPSQFKESHFATFPPALIMPMIQASTRSGDTVIDPFGGSGTVGQVCIEFARKAILIDLYPKHKKLMVDRCAVTGGLAL